MTKPDYPTVHLAALAPLGRDYFATSKPDIADWLSQNAPNDLQRLFVPDAARPHVLVARSRWEAQQGDVLGRESERHVNNNPR